MAGAQDSSWTRKYPIYQIYPRSFMDSTGNSTGDLKGIISKLPYLEWLGIKSVWLSPVYPSPMKDFGYDISNYCDIDPLFGDLNDFKQLINQMHAKGMHLIMDLVPNHSSNEHPWFKKSVQNIAPYKDYYIWKNAKMVDGKRQPPNNWQSVFTGSAWTWVESRQQYYYHAFLPEQPDLNYRNADVRKEMCNVFKYWLELGVDGFRIDAHLMQHAEFPDNSEQIEAGFSDEGGEKIERILYDRDQPELFELIKEWVDLVRDYGKKHNKHILMMTEAYCSDEHMKRYYEAGADWPFNFKLINWSKKERRHRKPHHLASQLRKDITDWMKVANMLIILLPGTPTVYYGDELGLEDIKVTYDQVQDPFGKNLGPEKYTQGNRDPCRAPMPWNADKFAGFTKSSKGPWLPLNPDFQQRNVESQKLDSSSPLNLFKDLLRLRQYASLASNGKELVLLNFGNENILAFVRMLHGYPGFMLILNIGTRLESISFDDNSPELLCLCEKESNTCFKSKFSLWSEYNYDIVIDTQQSDCADFKLNLNVPLKLESARGLLIKIDLPHEQPAMKKPKIG